LLSVTAKLLEQAVEKPKTVETATVPPALAPALHASSVSFVTHPAPAPATISSSHSKSDPKKSAIPTPRKSVEKKENKHSSANAKK